MANSGQSDSSSKDTEKFVTNRRTVAEQLLDWCSNGVPPELPNPIRARSADDTPQRNADIPEKENMEPQLETPRQVDIPPQMAERQPRIERAADAVARYVPPHRYQANYWTHPLTHACTYNRDRRRPLYPQQPQGTTSPSDRDNNWRNK